MVMNVSCEVRKLCDTVLIKGIPCTVDISQSDVVTACQTGTIMAYRCNKSEACLLYLDSHAALDTGLNFGSVVIETLQLNC